MEQYRILIADRNYSSWYFTALDNQKPLDIPEEYRCAVIPAEQKLFTTDVIEFVCDNGRFAPKLIFSPFRCQQMIAGVLLLENNKTFGRNESKKRLLYKCVPDDKHLPAFLVPYDIKLGFSKKIKNKYVVFKYDHWKDKHPHGVLVEVLGDVDCLDVFYEYQLYCKSLHISLTDFNNSAKNTLKTHSIDEYISLISSNTQYNVHDISTKNRYIFSIDPHNSTDYDDAFSISPLHDCPHKYRVCIYIANVYFWLETLGLWKSFSKRVSTIYLPDRKRPMLPSVLSDNLCSLQSGQPRFAFSLEMVVDSETREIDPTSMEFKNALIYVNKNHTYESVELGDDEHYLSLLSLTKKLDKGVRDSHDVVVYWMVMFNSVCGEKLAKAKTGIFRSMTVLNENTGADIPEYLEADTKRVIHLWNNTMGQYMLIGENSDVGHFMMKMKNYIHITSPIRRLVDLLNQMIFITQFGMIDKLGKGASEFLEYWVGQLDYVNTSMKSIRKVQNECEMLRKCVLQPEITKQKHVGVVFNRVDKNNGLYSYMVYLEELKMLYRLTTQQYLDEYVSREFSIFVFEDEHSFVKKMKLQIQ